MLDAGDGGIVGSYEGKEEGEVAGSACACVQVGFGCGVGGV